MYMYIYREREKDTLQLAAMQGDFFDQAAHAVFKTTAKVCS